MTNLKFLHFGKKTSSERLAALDERIAGLSPQTRTGAFRRALRDYESIACDGSGSKENATALEERKISVALKLGARLGEKAKALEQKAEETCAESDVKRLLKWEVLPAAIVGTLGCVSMAGFLELLVPLPPRSGYLFILPATGIIIGLVIATEFTLFEFARRNDLLKLASKLRMKAMKLEEAQKPGDIL